MFSVYDPNPNYRVSSPPPHATREPEAFYIKPPTAGELFNGHSVSYSNDLASRLWQQDEQPHPYAQAPYIGQYPSSAMAAQVRRKQVRATQACNHCRWSYRRQPVCGDSLYKRREVEAIVEGEPLIRGD
jgi:hypothetical protein